MSNLLYYPIDSYLIVDASVAHPELRYNRMLRNLQKASFKLFPSPSSSHGMALTTLKTYLLSIYLLMDMLSTDLKPSFFIASWLLLLQGKAVASLSTSH